MKLVFLDDVSGVAHGGDVKNVKNGFARLNELPEWYTYLLFLTVSAALGIRGLDKFRKK